MDEMVPAYLVWIKAGSEVCQQVFEKPAVKAFFDYIPYTVLSAMTFPAILYATGSYISALIGFVVSLILGFFEKSLLTVAIGACLASLISDVIMMYI